MTNINGGKRLRHIWNEDEDEMLHQLATQYGLKNEAISNLMNETFMTNVFSITEVKERWEYKNNPKINRGPFTAQEAQLLLKLVSSQVLKSGPFWSQIAESFENRPSPIMSLRFKQMIHFILRRLNLFFGSPEKQKTLDLKRIFFISDLSLLLIFYFAQQNLQKYHYNKFLYHFVEQSQKIVAYVQFFVDIGFTHQEDLKYYFNHRPWKNLQQMTCEQFSDMMEPIYLMDTLNRISFGQLPYDYGFVKKQRKPQGQSYLRKQIAECLEEEENRDQFKPIMSGKNLRHRPFTILTKDEVQTILNSDILTEMLPYQMKFSFWKKV